MSQFKYTLPSGSKFTVDAPTDTTQDQADYIFYSQVAAGALVGFVPGQSISGTSTSLAKFELSRLDRGTAGVDDTVILAIINGLPVIADIPTLIDVPLDNPITQANVADINSTGFTAPAIGSLTSDQIQALMAQVANIVGQSPDVMSNDLGVGQYGFSCQQLEMAGYIKPGTWQTFLQNNSSTLVDVLSAPGIWTGRGGISTADEFLQNVNAQNDAQATLMVNGYNSLQAAEVITTPASRAGSAVVGQVYTGSNQSLTALTTTVTNNVNSQLASLVTNASKYGTQLTAQWAKGLPDVTTITSKLSNIQGIGSLPGLPNIGSLTSGLVPNLSSVKTAMDSLGKVSGFAATASSTLTGGFDKLSNLSVSSLTSNLPSASALLAQAQGQITGQLATLQTSLGSLSNFSNLGSLTNFGGLTNLGSISSFFGGGGDSLIASVQRAAGFSNTVNRATVDVAVTKIFGSSKIPIPNFGSFLPESTSISAALDIGKAQSVLKNLQGQGTALLGRLGPG